MDSPSPHTLWPYGAFAAWLLGLQPGVLAAPLPGPPILSGGLVATPHALPVFPAQLAAASLGFPAIPSQWLRGPCLLPKLSECPAGCLGRGGTDLGGVTGQGYGVKGTLCLFRVCRGLKRKRPETERSASQQACPPDPDPASPRPWWSWPWAVKAGSILRICFPLIFLQG